ncbi:hypothetical protein EV215_1313 [Hypnocyclicus thermotrophus]|uniref:Uncharacterized protein n=1 Tax=Hypnocyclicus thermotrophus TaxID=1627895 RepID=A0AA46DY66_9FUSO|nr:hypothetical protein [Hypnocyclicus thermotrophus]TDT69774.1 hypothetical protein EV215_1313 [Hypnocyclicus thermotrophus]
MKMCILAKNNNIKKIAELSNKPKFICKKCLRTSNKKENLCKAEKIKKLIKKGDSLI